MSAVDDSAEAGPSQAKSHLSRPKTATRNSSLAGIKHRRSQSAAEKGLSGRPGTCTPQQTATLEEFRKRIEAEKLLDERDSLGTDDATLLRFLRARQFKLDKALHMIRNTKQWRNSVGFGKGMDDLYENQIDPFDYPEREAVSKYWPLFFHNTDKRGNPVNIQIDLKGLYKEVEPDRHWEIFHACCEMLPRECMPACAEAAKRNIEGAYCIVDLSGFSLMQFWHFKSRCFATSQDQCVYPSPVPLTHSYPETVVAIKIVNAPSGFSSIWRAVKPWLAPETARKIDILGGPKEFAPVLRNDIDAKMLPTFLGGDCECEGQGGCMFSGVGPWQAVRKEHGIEWARKGRFRNGQVEEIGSPLAQPVVDTPASETRPIAARQSTADHTADIARVATEREEEAQAREGKDEAADGKHSLAATLDKRMRGLFGGASGSHKGSSESLRSDSKRASSIDSSRRGSHDPPHGRATPPMTDSSSGGAESSIATLPKPDPAQGPTIKRLDSEGHIVRTLRTPSPPAANAPIAATAAA